MRNLSTETYDAIVEALLPHMATEDCRHTELLPVLSRMKAARIDWSGSSHNFTVRLVNRLTRAELIAVLQRLRVGDEQHEELEQLCVRIRQERRFTGARLRRASSWSHLAVLVVGVGVASPLGWWMARDDAPRQLQPSLRARIEPEPPNDMPASVDTHAPVAAGVPMPAMLAHTPAPTLVEPLPIEPVVVEPVVHERSKTPSKTASPRRDCRAVARELAQVLTNDAPRPGQCDEEGFMAIAVGADGTISTSGPLRGYPVEVGKSCGELRVKCPASW